MNSTLLVIAISAGAAVVAGTFALFGIFAGKKVPDRYERVGSFEIVTHTTRYRTGWNEGRLVWRTTESYSLRHREKPATIEGKSGMFGQISHTYETLNMVVTFPASEPLLLINVGDPNNSSFYYLVREKDAAVDRVRV